MSTDKSLRSKNALQRHRNVLTRGERIARLREEERWEEGRSAFGLPKVRTIRARRSAKAKAKAEQAAAAAEEAAAAEGVAAEAPEE